MWLPFPCILYVIAQFVRAELVRLKFPIKYALTFAHNAHCSPPVSASLSLSPPAPLLRPRLPLKLSFAFSVWVCVHRTHNVIKINLYPNKQQKVNENCTIYADMAGQGEKCRTKNWTLRVSPRWLFALLSFCNGPNAIMLALWHTHTTNSGSKYKKRNSMYVCVQIKYKDITIHCHQQQSESGIEITTTILLHDLIMQANNVCRSGNNNGATKAQTFTISYVVCVCMLCTDTWGIKHTSQQQ